MQILIKNTVRLRCDQCGNYKTICLNEICPLFADRREPDKCLVCGNILSKLLHQVPWWYGREIPKSVEFWWPEKLMKQGRHVTEIPEFFLEVNIWLAGIKGERRKEDEVIRYFENEAKKVFPNAEVVVISNEEWAMTHDTRCPFGF